MTDAERKQFINEYCRNVGNTKIRCDDCKFVENCVDYGWKDCKKFTPKPSEPMTNEQWLRQATKEEMEHTLTMLIMKDRFFADKECAYVNIRFGVHCWLKEKHE